MALAGVKIGVPTVRFRLRCEEANNLMKNSTIRLNSVTSKTNYTYPSMPSVLGPWLLGPFTHKVNTWSRSTTLPTAAASSLTTE
jgi:hypothetical protein